MVGEESREGVRSRIAKRTWYGRKAIAPTSTSELGERGLEARLLAGYGYRRTLDLRACVVLAAGGLASGICSIRGAKHKGRGTTFRCGQCATTLSGVLRRGELEDIAVTSTPVVMEVEAAPARSDAASMEAGAVIDVGRALVVPVANGGNRGVASQ